MGTSPLKTAVSHGKVDFMGETALTLDKNDGAIRSVKSDAPLQRADSQNASAPGASRADLSSEILGWGANNVAKPFMNAAVVTPWDAIASTTNLATDSLTKSLMPEMTQYSVPQADLMSPAWFAQSLSGGIGMILPYVIAGRTTGGAMTATGRTFKLEGEAARLLKNERIAQIGGAGIYDAMKEPGAGETRVGNSVASLVGFSMYEYGNAWQPELGLPARLGKRALVGMAGATAQKTLSSVISDHGNLPTTEQYMQTALSGAVLNIAMPPTQDHMMAAIDKINHKFGRGVPIDHYLASHENPADASGTLKDLVTKNPWVRVQDGADVDSADIRHAFVQLAGDHPDPARLGHELFHIQRAKEAEIKEGYDQAQAFVFSGNMRAAKAKFLEVYFGAELDARVAENKIGVELGTKPPLEDPMDIANGLPELESHPGHSYGEDAEEAFKAFADSYGRIRPSVDYGGVDAVIARNEDIQYNSHAYIDGESEGRVYDNGDGTVTKVFNDPQADVQKTVSIFSRLSAAGITVPEVLQYGTTSNGQPAIVMQKIGNGDNLRYQLISNSLTPVEREQLNQQYYAMGDALAKNNMRVDWTAKNMIFADGRLYLVDPSFLQDVPMDPETVDFHAGRIGPRPVERPSLISSTISKYRKLLFGA